MGTASATGSEPLAQPIRQRLPLDQLEDEIGRAVDQLESVDRAHVRVVEGGEQARLPLEAPQAGRIVAEVVGHRLDRHLAAEGGVERAVDAAHASAAEEPAHDEAAERCARLEGGRALPLDLAGQLLEGRPLERAPRLKPAVRLLGEAQQLLEPCPEVPIRAAGLVQEALALGGRPLEGVVQQPVEPGPVVALKHGPGLRPRARARPGARPEPASSPAAPCGARGREPPRSPRR